MTFQIDSLLGILVERYPSPLLGRVNNIFRRKEKTWVFCVPTASRTDRFIDGKFSA